MSFRDVNKQENKELSTSPDPLDVLSSPKVSYLTPLRLQGSSQIRQEFGLSNEIRRIGLFVDIGNDKEEVFFVSPKKVNEQVTKTPILEHAKEVTKDISNVLKKSLSYKNDKRDLDVSNEKLKKTILKRKKRTVKQCLNITNIDTIQNEKNSLSSRLEKKAKIIASNAKKECNAVASKKRKIESENYFDQNSIDLDNRSITSLASIDKLSEKSTHSDISKESDFEKKNSIPTQDASFLENNIFPCHEETVISNSQQKNIELSLDTINILKNDFDFSNNQEENSIEKGIKETNTKKKSLESEILVPLDNMSNSLSNFISPKRNKLIEVSSSSNISAKRVVDVLRRTGHFELESVIWGQKGSNGFEKIQEQKNIWTKNEWRLLEQLLIKYRKAKLALDEFLSLNNNFSKEEVNKRLKVLLFKKKENRYIYIKEDKTDNSMKVQDNKISSFIFGWKNWLKW
ncbi:hypothetical protein PMAC_001643 [Pneumocystis sp. 'macacae']|nr:hypothetical protein PMAC_001643 [Pneumocystis sp. 'macacae']